MKSRADLVSGWLLKGDSDLRNAETCLDAGVSLDTACFHAQQAAEKYIKAYLTAYGIDFPFIHNLEKLIELCTQQDASFSEIMTMGQGLTPYAVSLRYDSEFWPSVEIAKEALEAAKTIVVFVKSRLLKHPFSDGA